MKNLQDEIVNMLVDLHLATGGISCGSVDGFSEALNAPRHLVKLAIKQLVEKRMLAKIVINREEFYTFFEGIRESDVASITLWDTGDK